ncbi:MAG: FKBP-type peptidyl-prolyl cis-trans isomerase [Chitinophagales bacterium]|nr:FKBP-type peptidyl-prolyl cis-trans isomerase [Chitinophagales bacterium]
MIKFSPFVLFVLWLAGCRQNAVKVVQKGDMACFHYHLSKPNGTRLDDNRCFEPCAEETPSPFCVKAGVGYLVPAWDNALIGMKAGEFKTIKISPNEGWGTEHLPPGMLPNDTLLLTIEMISFK